MTLRPVAESSDRVHRSGTLPRRSRCLWLAIGTVAVTLTAMSAAQAPPSSGSSTETCTLSGSVVNSVTGEPIARALVRTNGMVQRTAFTDSEGHFQIDGLPA